MTPPVLRRSNIAAYAVDQGSGERYILSKWQEFELPREGVYALEGPNQAGKSVLVKLLMGALPPLVERPDVDCSTVLGDKKVEIRNVSDALQHGLVAVFQDDRLIPSMTVREQILVRHGTAKWRHYARQLWRTLHQLMPMHQLQTVIPSERVLAKLEPRPERMTPDSEIIERAELLLQDYEALSTRDYSDILDKYPRQLSGGATAVARLLLAQLHPAIRVLFLDEALAGVQADVWPHLVRALLKWREEFAVTMVVVTHNKDEMALWQPVESYVIKDGVLQRSSVRGYSRRHQGVPSRNGFFHVFEAPYRHPWMETFRGPFVVFIDTNVASLKPTAEISEFLAAHGQVHQILVDTSEKGKSLDTYRELIAQCLEVLPRPGGMIVCIGGGVLLNLAGFVGATVHRGLVPMVMIPTTVMSVADVAIGSKTALNLETLSGQRYLKHAVGVYSNPAAVVFDCRFMHSLDSSQLRDGLSECLKHAILHSLDLYRRVLPLVSQTSPDRRECFEVARDVSAIKAGLLARDPYERSDARALLFGHLHAHSLERATGFRVSHGQAVYWGILLDLKLSGSEIYPEILRAIRGGLVGPEQDLVEKLTVEELRAAYYADTHWDASEYEVIRVLAVGCYHPLAGRPLDTLTVSWQAILAAIETVRSELWPERGPL